MQNMHLPAFEPSIEKLVTGDCTFPVQEHQQVMTLYIVAGETLPTAEFPVNETSPHIRTVVSTSEVFVYIQQIVTQQFVIHK